MGVAQVVECLPNKCNALHSNPSTTQKKKEIENEKKKGIRGERKERKKIKRIIYVLTIILKNWACSQVLVAHTFNPSYSGGRDRRIKV
jgi:hypothetical protein